jgi:hypothetical protein
LLDAEETGVFGLPEFRGRALWPPPPTLPGGWGGPQTLVEAVARPVYAALNNRMIDVGTAGFGDVSVVFSPDYVRPMTILSPMDSGDWQATCNRSVFGSSGPPPFCAGKYSCVGMPHNCEAPERPFSGDASARALGTLADNYHIRLASSAGWWNLSAAEGILPQLARLCNTFAYQLPPAEGFRRYMEADIVGTVAYPAGVKMVIGTFPRLFGTDSGEALQRWCVAQGWVLVWALGPNYPGGGIPNSGISGPPVAMDARRTLDPTVLLHSTAGANCTVAQSDVATFKGLWKTMTGRDVSETAPSQYTSWFAELPRTLVVRALYGGECADASKCVGTRLDGHCVCYTPRTR